LGCGEPGARRTGITTLLEKLAMQFCSVLKRVYESSHGVKAEISKVKMEVKIE
jgi:hypothetical protein